MLHINDMLHKTYVSRCQWEKNDIFIFQFYQQELEISPCLLVHLCTRRRMTLLETSLFWLVMHSHTLIYTNIPIYKHACIHMHAHVHVHAYTCTHTFTYMHTHARTHSNALIHTLIYMYYCF